MNRNSAANYGGKSSYKSRVYAAWRSDTTLMHAVRVKEKKAKKELRRRDHGMRFYVDEFFGWRIQVLFGLPDTYLVRLAWARIILGGIFLF